MSSLPQWQLDSLQSLANQNKLSGLDPKILQVLDLEESGGKGGGINSVGYGGFFGLGGTAKGKYSPQASSDALLHDTSQAGFEQQAVIAAQQFTSYMRQTNGDPILAEEIYQSGKTGTPTPGSKLLASLLGKTGAITGSSGSPGTSGSGGSSADASGGSKSGSQDGQPTGPATANLHGAGAALQALNQLLNPKPASGSANLNPLDGFGLFSYAGATTLGVVQLLAVRGILAAGFVGMTIVGFNMLKGNTSSGIAGTINNAVGKAQSQARINNESRKIDLMDPEADRALASRRIDAAGNAVDARLTLGNQRSATSANEQAARDRRAAAANDLGNRRASNDSQRVQNQSAAESRRAAAAQAKASKAEAANATTAAESATVGSSILDVVESVLPEALA